MNPFLWLLIVPGALWWLLVALFCCGWYLAAKERRRKRVERTAMAVLTPDADIDIPLDDDPRRAVDALETWLHSQPIPDKEN